METVKITNSEFVRDMSSKAVLNTDTAGLSRYKATRRQMLRANQDHTDTKDRLSTIEREVTALKVLVGELAIIRKH